MDNVEAIQRRRKAEEERKKRIFNEKNRLIGVDVQGLAIQIQDKEMKLKLENEEKMYDAEKILHLDQIAQAQEKKVHETRKEIKKNIQDYRINAQKPEFRRDFDLYDPNLLKNDLPGRISDDDPRCSVSGLQKLDGEDLGQAERSQLQKNQMKQWISECLQERTQMMNKQCANDMKYQKELLELDQRLLDQQRHQNQQEKVTKIEVQALNAQLAHQQAEQQQARKKREIEESLNEIRAQIESDLLSENKEASKSSFGPHRVIPYQWKGMTTEEIQNIRSSQIKQINNNQMQTEENRRKKQEWEECELNAAYQAYQQNKKFENDKRKLNYEQRKFNEELSEKQKEKLKSWELHLKHNVPKEEYFEQFNTSSR